VNTIITKKHISLVLLLSVATCSYAPIILPAAPVHSSCSAEEADQTLADIMQKVGTYIQTIEKHFEAFYHDLRVPYAQHQRQLEQVMQAMHQDVIVPLEEISRTRSKSGEMLHIIIKRFYTQMNAIVETIKKNSPTVNPNSPAMILGGKLANELKDGKDVLQQAVAKSMPQLRTLQTQSNNARLAAAIKCVINDLEKLNKRDSSSNIAQILMQFKRRVEN
jgi:uncharacterized protein YicC (UPF0701 family)